MKAIKALVVFMGILLLAGLGLLGYGVATQTGKGAKPKAAQASPAGTEFGALSVPLPAGGKVEQTLVVGERLVLRITGAGPERFVVLDPGQGTVSGSFVLSPEAPAAR